MKKKKIYNAVIIGLGKAGYLYNLKNSKSISHAEAINLSKNFKLIAGVDSDSNKLKSFKKFYRTNTYKSLKMLIKKEKFDLIILSVPTSKQYKVLKQILEVTKNKFILCEKPCTENLSQIKKISNLLERKNSKCFVNFQRLYLNSTKKIKKILFKKDNIKINVTYSNGILNSASHYISLFLSFFGNNYIVNKSKFKKKLSRDFASNFTIRYPKRVINFKYKNNYKKIHGAFEVKNRFFHLKYLSGGHKIYIKNYKSKTFKKIKSDIMLSQSKVYEEVYKEINRKKNNLSSLNNAIQTMSVIKQIK